MERNTEAVASVSARRWGRAGIETSPIGLGCWAIGGEWRDSDGAPAGWGRVDDDESIRAIRHAVDQGITFFDTADVYGTGHSERVLGTALRGWRDSVVLASKWGNTFDEDSRTMTGSDATPEYVREALVASLGRLGTDHLDLYQLHLSMATPEEGARLRDACEELVSEGLIRGYAWSTDDTERAEVFAAGQHCTAVQHECSVLHDAPQLLALCARHDLASINRSPLAMGLLTGKYRVGTQLPHDDIRAKPPVWLRYFEGGTVSPQWLARAEAVRAVLTADGRTLAQGALGWLLARSPLCIPIPGFRSVAQVTENAATMLHGPLLEDQMDEIDRLLGIHSEGAD